LRAAENQRNGESLPVSTRGGVGFLAGAVVALLWQRRITAPSPSLEASALAEAVHGRVSQVWKGNDRAGS
jgi:NAD(P)H-hydrate repair Nnr-like enzyme with NAD(P)H-hydrate dehydratase domain